MSDDAVWKALANSHRRRMLDQLARHPATTGALAAEFPELSRFAVMQHLGVLEHAGLLVVRRDGRRRFNHVNAVPIQQAYDRWVRGLGRTAAEAAVALQRHIEKRPGVDDADEKGDAEMGEDKTIRTVRIENEIDLAAPIERCFAAMTTEQREWYPYNYGGDRLKTITFETRVGGQCYEDWGDGKGTLYGTVWFYDPPTALCLRGHLAGGVALEHWWRFEAKGDRATTMQQSLVAVGPISDDDEVGIRVHGDLSKVEDHLRRYLEAG